LALDAVRLPTIAAPGPKADIFRHTGAVGGRNKMHRKMANARPTNAIAALAAAGCLRLVRVGVAVVVEGLDVPASYPQNQESSNHSHDCDNGQKDQTDFPEFSEDWKNAKPSQRIAGGHHRHVGQRHFSFSVGSLFHFRSCLEKL
jgi:hypothetical protein